jgi:pyruvate dehydrogenase E2 component (dihydrolipoamide acetyltransferase)
MSSFVLPDLGEGLQEAEIVAWHVAEGDHVVADQPLVSVETEKAVVEVPSPRSGRIVRLLGKLHDRIKVGAPIVEFEEGAHPDGGTVVGDLTSAPSTARSAMPPQPEARTATLASPAVRALARERGVDLAAITGHGPRGVVTREDVERAVVPAGGAIPGEPLRGMRRSMAANMARAHAEVVPATLFDEADVEAWWKPGADVMVRFVRGVIAGCRAVPALNAWFDARTMVLEAKPRIDLGIAVDTATGLIVPVLRDVGKCDASVLQHHLSALIAAAHARTVSLSQLRDATITLSNFGRLAGTHATLVIIPPQVAIIGAGRIAPKAVPAHLGAAFRHTLPLSLTFDHRAATGGDAARFLQAMIADLNSRH